MVTEAVRENVPLKCLLMLGAGAAILAGATLLTGCIY
jgi:hypothetical protein